MKAVTFPHYIIYCVDSDAVIIMQEGVEAEWKMREMKIKTLMSGLPPSDLDIPKWDPGCFHALFSPNNSRIKAFLCTF